jgi:hypothetical protein
LHKAKIISKFTLILFTTKIVFMQQGLPGNSTDYRKSWQENHQYQLVLPVHQDLVAALAEIREPFLHQYGITGAQLTPQITVGTFSATPAEAEMMMRWMTRLLRETSSFTLWLNNFSGLPPHLLFMRVQQTQGMADFVGQMERLNQYLSDYALPSLQLHKRWILPVMESVPGMLYDKALNYLARLELGFSLPVNEILLQKQAIGIRPWALVQRLALQPHPAGKPQPWYAPLTHQHTA